MKKNTLLQSVVPISIFLFFLLKGFSLLVHLSDITLFYLIFSWALLFWIFDIMPSGLTGIWLIILLVLFKVLTVETALTSFASPIIWLVFGALVINITLEETGLSRRIAMSMLAFSQNSIKKIVFYLMLIPHIFAFFIPSAFARIGLVFPIAVSITEELPFKNKENINKIVFLGISFAGIFSTTLVPNATGTKALSWQLMQTMIKPDVLPYWKWFLMGAPIAILGTFFTYHALFMLFPLKGESLSPVIQRDYQSKIQNGNKGKISRDEKRVVFLLITLLLIYFTDGLIHSLGIIYPTLLVAILILTPGIEIINWKQTLQRINWNLLFLIAAALTLARAIDTLGLLNQGVAYITWLYQAVPDQALFVFIFILLIILIRTFFITSSALTAILLPVTIDFAKQTELPVANLAFLTSMLISAAFIFPFCWPAHLIAFSNKKYKVIDQVKIGFLALFVYIIIMLLGYLYYWPLFLG